MKESNPFEKYDVYLKRKGKIVNVIPERIDPDKEAFELFKSLFDHEYGSIEENDNLVSIHTGGWSDNEELIEQFRCTAYWLRYHKITASGGHYFFNTDIRADKEWNIIAS